MNRYFIIFYNYSDNYESNIFSEISIIDEKMLSNDEIKTKIVEEHVEHLYKYEIHITGIIEMSEEDYYNYNTK